MSDATLVADLDSAVERRLARLTTNGVLTTRTDTPVEALCRAASDGDVATINKLLRQSHRAPSIEGTMDGMTPLMFAAEQGHLDAVQFLVQRGAKVEARSQPDGVTALFIAAKGPLSVVRYLVEECKADVHAAALNGCTVLHAAAQGGRVAVVEFLLSRGTDPSRRDAKGRKPVVYAQHKNATAVVEMLKLEERKARLLQAAASGDLAGVAECMSNSRDRLSSSRSRASFSTAASDDPEWLDATNNALLLAASGGHDRIVALLVDRGADVDARARASGRSALHLAALKGHLETTRLLLELGADTRPVDHKGLRALDDAASSNIARLLMVSRRQLDRSVSFATDSGSTSQSLQHGSSQADDVSVSKTLERRGSTSALGDCSSFKTSTRTTTDRSSTTGSFQENSYNNNVLAVEEQPKPWDDVTIVKARIPLDKLELDAVMSRGAYGEVYRGWYRGNPVAIKMLHPSMRQEMTHISAFLQEIKIMATMDHPNIVQFVGVAWDAITEVCAVSEFMAGGDLRALLGEFHTSKKPRGFDFAKVKIAEEVAQALTYLHSFDPVVLHRDLKSRNILLSADQMSAKVTDFGSSRVQADMTMTIGVGTSLWMAPEVIMGERYGEKADVFSFGVVLSELATHELPYAHATARESGQAPSIAAILHAVTSGTLKLDFAAPSDGQRSEMVSLARECVQMKPSDRPTAVTVAYELRKVLRTMA